MLFYFILYKFLNLNVIEFPCKNNLITAKPEKVLRQ